MQFLRYIFIFVCFSLQAAEQSPNIFTFCATGEKVVDQSIEAVGALFSGLLDPVPLFLKRVACVESHYGEHKATFRPDYFGGIWQLDVKGFRETQRVLAHPSLRKLHKRLALKLKTFSSSPMLPWTRMNWESCLIPLYSCIGARLFLALIPAKIPDTLSTQAAYWKKHYNTEEGAGTEDQFREMETID